MNSKILSAFLSTSVILLSLSGVAFAEDNSLTTTNTVESSVSVLATHKHTADESLKDCLKAERTTHISNVRITKEAFNSAMDSVRSNFKTAMIHARDQFTKAKIAAKGGTPEADQGALRVAREDYLSSVKLARIAFGKAAKATKENFVQAKADEKEVYEIGLKECKK